MELNKDDLAVLAANLSKDEIDRIHRLLHEWNIGPEASFPVQLALLTSIQWRVAASVPRSLNDSRKSLEQHLMEYRRQTAALVSNLAAVGKDQTGELKNLVKAHAATVNQTDTQIRYQLVAMEEAAKEFAKHLAGGVSEWQQAKHDFATERQRLEKERKDLAARVQWRDHLWAILLMVGMMAIGMVIGGSLLLLNDYEKPSPQPVPLKQTGGAIPTRN
jgi:gas vesicle protein